MSRLYIHPAADLPRLLNKAGFERQSQSLCDSSCCAKLGDKWLRKCEKLLFGLKADGTGIQTADSHLDRPLARPLKGGEIFAIWVWRRERVKMPVPAAPSLAQGVREPEKLPAIL
ncbi:hypothetical protein [Kamptonema formosum]|uniref:hypothetical protein n=1 Tax=Kamptonema formosum TaxID=331992 RepID=UPI0003478E44|nr:hypothetical protein [Oscillatoria sp. PCC 10802]